MGRTLRTTIGFVLLPFLLLACGKAKPERAATGKAGASIAGTYSCNREGEGTDVPVYAWELREDGTLKNASPPDIVELGVTSEEKIVEGTWTAKGNSGKITSENQDYPFTIEGDRLVFRGGKFVCFNVKSFQSP